MKASPVLKKYRVFLILTIGLLSVLFFIGGPDFHSQRSFKAAWNLGHIIYFALLPVAIFLFTPLRKSPVRLQVAVLIGVTIILGALVELFQYGFYRTPDSGDLFRNMIGVLIAIFFMLPIRFSIRRRLLLWIKIGIIALVATQFQPIAVALIDEHHARRYFPILCDFQSPMQLNRWLSSAAISIDDAIDNADNRVMRVDLTTDLYSGVRLKYFPEDWEGYQWFQVRVYNPSSGPLPLICRIHDAAHSKGAQPFRYQDRFNRVYNITEGWNTIAISLKEVRQAPDTRRMDMGRIQEIGLFASRLPKPRVIYIDDLKLF